MILYGCIIGACALAISTAVSLACQTSYWQCLCVSVLAIVLVILVDALTATVCRLLPKKYADHERAIFNVSAKEKKAYEKMKIRKWKDLVPEIGHFTGFRKNKIAEPKNVEYIDRFLLEICYGELGHALSVPLGFLILLLFPTVRIWLPVAIPVAIINIFLNLPSLFILRYNSYKLKILRKSLLKKQRRKQATQTQDACEAAATIC